jgi:hypothetical protein
MIITFVAEFQMRNHFQWYDAWTIDNQLKNNCLIKDVKLNCDTYKEHKPDSLYWDWIHRADVVFVYCSRCIDYKIWEWWKLPILVKPLMKPTGKMVVQFDEDLIGLFHNDWTWWIDNPYEGLTPQQFLDSTKILEVGDLYFTVLENPEFAKYTTKPVKFMPLPHIYRYASLMTNITSTMNNKGALNMHEKNIALMLHTSHTSSVDHTIENVIEKVNMPIVVFSSATWVNPKIRKPKSNIEVNNFINLGQYMEKLSEKCFLAIDDSENYIGWSRFVMECAMSYIPCIGSTYAVKMLFPELYTEPKDYKTQINLINKLNTNEEFYKQIAIKGHHNLSLIDANVLCEKMASMFRELYGQNENCENIKLELFLELLDKMLPYYKPPPRPSKNSTVYDNFYNKMLDESSYDNLYGLYQDFMDSSGAQEKYIRLVLDSKYKKLRW